MKPATRTGKRRRPVRPETASLQEFFGPDGPLAASLPGYEHREEQVQVAEGIEAAMLACTPCLAEAGTGVGKSLAYLVPAVRAALRGQRTVISTHTINLQIQLITKDIPLVLSLFPRAKEQVRATIMKGRGNYLCKQDFENAHNDLFMITDPGFRRMQGWASGADCTGDSADLPFTFAGWPEIAANQDTCRGQECRFYNSCFYYRMRRTAAESSLLVVNHALFLSDLALRLSDPESGVLPPYDHVVFDEAHHLEDVATRSFGIEFGSRRMTALADRIRHVRGLDLDAARLTTLEELNATLFGPFLQTEKSELFFEEALSGELRTQIEAGAGATCNAISVLEADLLKNAREDDTLHDRLEGLARMSGRMRDELDQLFFAEDENAIRWADVYQGGTRSGRREKRVTLYKTPISVAPVLQAALWERMKSRGSVVLTSATLSNSGTFSYLRTRLGVPEDAAEVLVGSPFDYKAQALLYVPGHLPAPAKTPLPGYTEQIIAEIERLLRLSDGHAFLLFTSHTMLNRVYESLNGRLPFPLFKQGDQPAGKLVEAFRESGNGCLLGAQTFWEGVDIQGQALCCVIIDRLPFAVPDSPITRARVDAITAAGGDWFRDFAIPQAQIKLKQGFGRLVRTRADCGIVCILDSRLITREYGAEFVRYLPPAARASKWNRVERFWRERHPPAAHPEMPPSADGG